jgi:hypothetical protein
MAQLMYLGMCALPSKTTLAVFALIALPAIRLWSCRKVVRQVVRRAKTLSAHSKLSSFKKGYKLGH